MPSSPQNPVTQIVFDYIYDTAGKAVANAKVTSTLNFAGASDTSPIVNIGPLQQTTQTDSNGYWQFNLIPNPALTPTGTSYTIETPYNSYAISVPNSAGPFQSSSLLVNAPSIISPAVTGLTGPITITGSETVTGTLTVAGTTTLAGVNTGSLAATANSSIAGDLTVLSPGRLLFTAAASKIVPGATSLSHRNNADSADNLLITDAGNATLRASLTVGNNLTANGSVLTISGAASSILMQGAGTADIVGGTTGLTIANNANNANNLQLTDAGIATFRNAVNIPPSASGTLPTTSFGTLPIKIDEQTPSGVASTNAITVPTWATLVLTEWEILTTSGNTTDVAFLQFNSDNGANYNAIRSVLGGTYSSTGRATGQTSIVIGAVPGSSTEFAAGSTKVFFPRETGKPRRVLSVSTRGDSTNEPAPELTGGTWTNTLNGIATIVYSVSAGNYAGGSRLTTWAYP